MDPRLTGLLVAALLIACDGDAALPREHPAPGASVQQAKPEAASLVATRREDGRLEVRAVSAPRLRVLREIGAAAGLEIRAGAGRPAPRRLDLSLSGAASEEAIAAVLADVPYHLHYEADDEGEVALRAVTVGLLPSPSASLPGDGSALARVRERQRERRSHTPEELARLRAERADRERERRETIEQQWDARDPEARAEAVRLMSADEDAERLLASLARDPSPAVRVEAAGSLADVEAGPEAVEVAGALLAALEDPSPEVVAAAVAALEDVHDVLPDPRIGASVAALEEDPDPLVREAVTSFREWTETD